MSTLLQMMELVSSASADFLRQPDLLLVSLVVVALVYGQYARVAATENRLFGAVLTNPRRQTFLSLLAGIVGGLFATALFVFVGVPLSGTGIWYLWFCAILLALIHPRFLCFSYAGGLLSLIHLIWGVQGVNVPAVIALVAALHLVEASLIAVTGSQGAMPIYARFHDGKVVGGFILQRFWPIPFVALIAGFVGPEVMSLTNNISMPTWWPLIQPGFTDMSGHRVAFSVLPVVAALGYSDLVLTCLPAQKARITATTLFTYSLILLTLAAAAQYAPIWAWAAAIFAPGGHEAVIYLGKRRELWGKPLFAKQKGVLVLDIIPGLPAEKLGLKTGDVVTSVNGEPVHNKADLVAALQPWVIGIRVDVVNIHTGLRRTLKYEGKVPPLGAVFAPEANEPYFVDPYQSHGLLHRLWQRMIKWLGGFPS